MIGRAAGGDDYLVDIAQLLIGEAEALKLDAPVADARVDGGLYGAGLLHDLLEHEVLIAALFRGLGIPQDAGGAFVYLAAGAVVDAYLIRRDGGKLPLVKIDDCARMADERGDVGGEEVLVRADAEDERAAVLHGHKLAGVIVTDDADGVGAFKPGDGLHDGALEVAVIVHLQEIHNDLGVGLALEHVAMGAKLLTKLGIVFDYAVVHDGKVPVV